MHCELCAQPIEAQKLAVATTGGQRVHVHCADAQAQLAWRQRVWWAVVDGVLLLSIVAISALLLPVWARIGVSIGSVIAHRKRHARFWHVCMRDLRQARHHHVRHRQ